MGDRGLSHEQFARFRDWGLVLGDDSGRWTEADVGRAVRAQHLGKTVRSMPRRVLILRQNYFEFPVPAEQVRRAMLAILPAIDRAGEKMKRLDAACQKLSRQLDGTASLPQRRSASKRRPPPAQQWVPLLRGADAARLDERVSLVYHLAIGVLAIIAPEVNDVPFEERVALLMVRDLAVRPAVLEATGEATA